MNLNTLKYFTALILTIYSLNFLDSYGQETIKLKPLATKLSKSNFNSECEFFATPNIKYYNSFSIGLGLTKALPLKSDLYGNNDIRFLLTLNLNFILYKNLALNTGFNIHKVELTSSGTNLDLIVTPNYKFNFLKNKFSCLIGFGPLTTFYFENDFHITFGLFASLRTQYNLNKKYSLGLEISHPEYFGEYTNYFILRNNLYFSMN